MIAESVLNTDYFLYRSKYRIYHMTHEIRELDFFQLTGDPEIVYLKKPNSEHKFWWDALFTTNQFGLWGDDLSSGNKFKILFVGDSVTFGIGVQQKDTFPAVLREKLPEVSVAVLAAPGYDTNNEVRLIKDVIEIDHFKPDLIVLQYGANDYGHPTKAVKRERYYFYKKIDTLTFGPPQGIYKFLLDHSNIFFRLNDFLTRRAFFKNKSLSAYPDRFQEMKMLFTELNGLAKKHSFQVVLLSLPYQDTGSVGKEFFPLFKNALDLKPFLPSSEQIWFDNMHPNAQGHRLIAQNLIEYLLGQDLLGNQE